MKDRPHIAQLLKTSVAVSGLLTLAAPAIAASILEEQLAFSPVTRGGLVPGTQIVTVTNLDNKGEGSLRHALEQPGPKIIVFEVGGVIKIDGDLQVETPNTTIAGETAPSPGIIIDGAGMRIRSQDIVVRHLAVRVQPSDSEEVNESRDGLSVGGNPERYGGAIRNVVFENVSVSWGIDENVGVWDENTGNVQFRSVIISEALRNGGHPEGAHSKGMLVGSDIDNVSIVDSLFAHNVDRHPRVSPRAQVDVERNVVYNPQQVGIEIFVDCETEQPPKRVARNVLLPGADTYDEVTLYAWSNPEGGGFPEFGDPECENGWASIDLQESSPEEDEAIVAGVLEHAGFRPYDRDDTDTRIVEEVTTTTGGIRDQPTPVNPMGDGSRAFEMPTDPLSTTADGRMAIEAALCEAHLELGGLPSADCQ
jgi:hypothetical protein